MGIFTNKMVRNVNIGENVQFLNSSAFMQQLEWKRFDSQWC